MGILSRLFQGKIADDRAAEDEDDPLVTAAEAAAKAAARGDGYDREGFRRMLGLPSPFDNEGDAAPVTTTFDAFRKKLGHTAPLTMAQAEKIASDDSAEYRKSYEKGARLERARLEAIITSQFAEGREALALYLAMETDIPAADALAVLQNSPLTPKEIGLLAEMKAVRQPSLGYGGGPDVSSMSEAQRGEFEARRVLSR